MCDGGRHDETHVPVRGCAAAALVAVAGEEERHSPIDYAGGNDAAKRAGVQPRRIGSRDAIDVAVVGSQHETRLMDVPAGSPVDKSGVEVMVSG